MSMPLLQTKFYRPPPHPNLVQRLQLIDQVRSERVRSLTLVSAPAGFGKTTLVSQWLTDLDGTVAWLSLDDDDNDPVRFLTYMIAALQSCQPLLGENAQLLLSTPEAPSVKAVLTHLINELSAHPLQLLLVLDDYHVITTSAIHEAMIFLADHLPLSLRLVLITRADPPMPLARWRVRGQLAEIRADDLRFTVEETATFLNELMGLRLATADIVALEARTEGWIAGLQLAALSLQGVGDRANFIAAFSGSNHYIVDYLVEEVLSQQPDEVKSFLLQTSILGQLCGSLCDVVVGATDDSHSSSQTLLEKLDHANLFLIPLDAERKWYRYHHLFAEALSSQFRQMQRSKAPSLHQRASGWYEQQERWSEAIHHALAAADYARAARLIEHVGFALFAQTDIQHSLKRWLSTLPAEIIGDRPRLCLIYAWILLAHMDISTAFRWVDEAEAALQRTISQLGDAPIDGEIAAMRAALAAYNPSLAPSAAIAWGRQALEILTAAQPTFRCIAASALGMIYMKQGDVMGAEQALAEANRMGREAGNVYLVVVAAAHQVAMQRARGSLRLALATCQETLTWASQRGVLVYPTFGGLYLNLADLLREKNELGSAQGYAEEAVAHSDQEVNSALFIISRLVLMRIKQAQGDWAQVWMLMREVSTLAAQYPMIIHSTLLPAITAQFQVAERASSHDSGAGLALALAWAQSSAWEEGELLSSYRFFDFIYLYEHSRIARTQIFIAWARTSGDARLLPETLAYLERLRQIAEAGNLIWLLIKVHLLQAMAHHTLGAVGQALAALAYGLRLAQAEGFIRIFVDEGEPIRLLLLELRSQLARQPLDEERERLPAYIDRLLVSFSLVPETKPPETMPDVTSQWELSIQEPKTKNQHLIEPLTEREFEILRLMHRGLSNREIADKLVVAMSTVKKHINHLFDKLGATSRTHSLARARELDLL